MTPNMGGWIHNFTVTDTQQHKKGYTIYKITSIIFPRAVPQALTCVTVWKRFHDVKRLYREMRRRHKSLHLGPVMPPEPTDCSFFKRFNADVITRRREYILELLEFAAQYPALYKCHAFAQFFSVSTPEISPLVEKGDIRKEPVVEKKICSEHDLLHETQSSETVMFNLKKNAVHEENNSVFEENAIEPTFTAVSNDEKTRKDYYCFLTPMASIESDDSDYIYEAALKFSHAVEAEANLEYQKAYDHYKSGVELLQTGSKDDLNDDRKFIAKAKISKYLARADDIHHKFLHEDSLHCPSLTKSHFQLSMDVVDSIGGTRTAPLERPWNELSKFEVLRVLGDRVIHVRDVTEQHRPTYVLKGIEKPSGNSSILSIFLPQSVPFMVDLLAVFQSDQKIFLLLKYAEGGRLYDYMKTYTPLIEQKPRSFSQLFPEISDGHEKTLHVEARIADTSDLNELVRCSQELLESVSNTLNTAKAIEATATKFSILSEQIEANTPCRTLKSIKIPEASMKQWACELAVAIDSLHGKGVILGDLFMDNLLLGMKGQLLLSYFYQHEGQVTDHTHKAYHPAALDGHFVAPERPLGFKSDWWSYGVVLYQLIVGVPFKALHPGHIDLYGFVQYPENIDISADVRDLLENLLQQIPEERYEYAQIRTHIFFSDTNWESAAIGME